MGLLYSSTIVLEKANISSKIANHFLQYLSGKPFSETEIHFLLLNT